ncbi:uncharacterized protein LOC122327394 isoform X2 [Puntigrus tetrazona]|uniref:uncharacterized protein LOC122327394 isoform X2 n=1 Tax=Puntigrus tetrazona TaxID=1606681 RepID=UPI001C8AE1F5|nr:uncharacterized protein LOC122327394 isoform X2 [Puntigrus tetrazona]
MSNRLWFCLCLWRLIGVFGGEIKFVKIGESVTLNSDFTEMMDDDKIQWRFKNTLIAEINATADIMTVYDDVLDGRFRDRLKMNDQTGSLTITNITMKHAGDYELEINNMSKNFFLRVYDEIPLKEGESVTLNTHLTQIMDDDRIQWRFGFYSVLAYIYRQSSRTMTLYDDVLDGRFRDRLKMDDQTGSLTIMNTTMKHVGHYILQFNNMHMFFFLTVYDDISVKEGDSVTLNSDLTQIMDDDEIQWWFGNEITLIAGISKQANITTVYDDVLDGRFRDRLKLDNQTGSLTITDITMKHKGRYLLLIFGSTESLKAFRVSVSNSEHCCGFTEAVIRLVLSALVGVATVLLLVYDIRSRRAKRDQTHVHTTRNIEM